MPKEFDLEALQKMATLVPAITAGAFLLGFTYDAGFFWKMDHQLYSAFTLTEHTVFALQALPVGLGLIAVASVIYMSQFLLLFANSSLLRVVGVALVAVSLATVCYSIGASSTAVTILGIGTFILSYSEITHLGGAMKGLCILFPPIALAFSLGEDGAGWVMMRPLSHEITVQANSAVMGSFLRAGSVGFLYLDDKRRPIFRKWEGVISVVKVK